MCIRHTYSLLFTFGLFTCWLSYWKSDFIYNISNHFFYRMSALFGHLSTAITSDLVDDDIILCLLGIFWPLLEKLFRSSHMENTSLSAAACRSLSSAIHSCGKLNGFLNWEIWSCIANVSVIWSGICTFTGHHFHILLPKVLECLSTNFLLFQRHDCFLRTGNKLYFYCTNKFCLLKFISK